MSCRISYRLILSAGALALTFTVFLPAQTPAAKSTSKNWTVPRTPDGKPDLQGVWTNATLTPLERPAAMAGKATVTDAEAAVFEKKNKDDEAKYDGKADNPIADSLGSGGTGGYNALFVDHGTELARVDGVKRTSLIIDPPDGKIPPLTDAARQRASGALRAFTRYDSVKDRPLSERCIIGFGSTSGPPMLPVLYNNNYEIVQTPNAVLILVEMVHDIRVIRINGTHKPAEIRQLLGDSIGHWEGDTLVVDTTNFTDKTRFRGSSENLHVIERFRRVDSHTILYRATVDDPATYTKQWTWSIHLSQLPVRFTSMPATKAITPCRTSSGALAN
jgi:hypothetical protein